MSETSTDASSETAGTPERRRRARTGRKRTRFLVPPRQPASVRALWQSATTEEQKTAHELCMAILEVWLGKASKTEVARRLEVPPLRIWQLSQMALSGMLAGLLRQPKTRRRGRPLPPPSSPEEDPRILRRRIVELERKLKTTEDLVRVLKDLPWAPKETPGTAQEASDGGRARAGRGSKGRRGAQASRGGEARRRQAALGRRPGGDAGGAGAVTGRDDAHAGLVEEAGGDGRG
jgi:hypothetical protein